MHKGPFYRRRNPPGSQQGWRGSLPGLWHPRPTTSLRCVSLHPAFTTTTEPTPPTTPPSFPLAIRRRRRHLCWPSRQQMDGTSGRRAAWRGTVCGTGTELRVRDAPGARTTVCPEERKNSASSTRSPAGGSHIAGRATTTLLDAPQNNGWKHIAPPPPPPASMQMRGQGVRPTHCILATTHPAHNPFFPLLVRRLPLPHAAQSACCRHVTNCCCCCTSSSPRNAAAHVFSLSAPLPLASGRDQQAVKRYRIDISPSRDGGGSRGRPLAPPLHTIGRQGAKGMNGFCLDGCRRA